jgi:hypothetical protein
MIPKNKSILEKRNIIPILSLIESKTNTSINYIKWNSHLYIRTAVDTIQKTYGSYVFSACNKVPTHLNPKNYIHNDTPPIRGPSLNFQHLRPFINLYKPEIVEIYRQEGIMDLIDMTYSCGYSINLECGNCFFCLEKKWGLGLL